jgi:hypothetical protein
VTNVLKYTHRELFQVTLGVQINVDLVQLFASGISIHVLPKHLPVDVPRNASRAIKKITVIVQAPWTQVSFSTAGHVRQKCYTSVYYYQDCYKEPLGPRHGDVVNAGDVLKFKCEVTTATDRLMKIRTSTSDLFVNVISKIPTTKYVMPILCKTPGNLREPIVCKFWFELIITPKRINMKDRLITLMTN